MTVYIWYRVKSCITEHKACNSCVMELLCLCSQSCFIVTRLEIKFLVRSRSTIQEEIPRHHHFAECKCNIDPQNLLNSKLTSNKYCFGSEKYTSTVDRKITNTPHTTPDITHHTNPAKTAVRRTVGRDARLFPPRACVPFLPIRFLFLLLLAPDSAPVTLVVVVSTLSIFHPPPSPT